MSDKLKPCPFCGDETVVNPLADNTWEAKCKDGCEAVSHNWISEKAAIDNWNRRHIEDALTADLAQKQQQLAEYEGILLCVWLQFAYRTTIDGIETLSDGGLSTLEDVKYLIRNRIDENGQCLTTQE